MTKDWSNSWASLLGTNPVGLPKMKVPKRVSKAYSGEVSRVSYLRTRVSFKT